MPSSRPTKNTSRSGGKRSPGGEQFSKKTSKSPYNYRDERSKTPSYIDPSGVTPMTPKKGGTRMVHNTDHDMG